MGKPLKLGSITAQPGARTDGYLLPSVDTSETREALRIPVSVIAGRSQGPTVLVTAATHGGEYPGIEACLKLIDLIQPEQLSGNLIVISRLNSAAFFGRSIYVSPVDGLNLNRVFPGDPHGRPTERIAHLLTSEVMSQADYYIDLHSGDINEDLLPFAFCYVSGDPQRDRTSQTMASQFPGQFVLASRTQGATLTGANRCGIPAVLSEAGGRGRVDPDAIDFHLSGVLNILTTLGMYPGLGKQLPDREVSVPAWVSATQTGYLRIGPSLGERVTEGQVIGDVRGDFGKQVETIRAPGTGVLFFRVDSLAITAGELLAGVVVDPD